MAAPPLPAGSDLHIPGLSSFITPNNSFYRVDTALLLPQVDPSTWQLRIHGMVQREVTITFAELLRRPLIEAYVTLTCVSDPVGGPYVGNAKWLGARLADLIRQARPRAGASQLLCTSVDGFTSGTPLQVVLDGRDALLTVAMNGTALPVEHGFPARMVTESRSPTRSGARSMLMKGFQPLYAATSVRTAQTHSAGASISVMRSMVFMVVSSVVVGRRERASLLIATVVASAVCARRLPNATPVALRSES